MNKATVKRICLACFIILIVVIALTNDKATNSTMAFTGKLQSGHTEAPGERTCAVIGCHTGPLESDPEKFKITSDLEERYEPGRTYKVMVTHTTDDLTRMRWGFQLTVLTSDNKKAGELINRPEDQGPVFTRVVDESGSDEDEENNNLRQYIQHNSNGTFAGTTNTVTWEFCWIAPERDLGPVIFYAAGLQGNNNNRSTGDRTYTAIFSPISPKINAVRLDGKKLLVSGEDFGEGATICVNDKDQKTANDKDNPNTELIAKKAGKKIDPGETVTVVVKNPGGNKSNEVLFTRPVE